MDPEKFPFFLFVIRIISTLPTSLAYRFAALWGRIYFPRHKEIPLIQERLRQCFPFSQELIRQACNSYKQNVSINALNVYRYKGMDSNWLKKHTTIINKELLETSIKTGKGILILTAHQHHLVLLGVTLGLMGYSINPILMNPHKTVPSYLKTYMRRMISTSEVHYHGGKYILVDFEPSYVRHMYRLFEQKKIVISANDFPQDIAPKRRITSPFLGRKISCPYGSLEVALNNNATVITAFIKWLGEDQFELKFDSLDTSEGLAATMNQYVRQLENFVTQDPGGWEGWKWDNLFQQD